MNHYVQIEFKDISAQQSEILIAHLSEAGIEGFEEEVGVLKAFVTENQFDVSKIRHVADELKLDFSTTIIEDANWNQLWESSFEPVTIDDFVAIRAQFHPHIPGVEHEIIITPKMSFGTGHHATTHMMIEQMREIDFKDQMVYDFGTGTGILAILAEKLGAKKIVAVDNDEWSILNAAENIQQNKCAKIELLNDANMTMNIRFGIILANINKSVILDNFSLLVSQLLPGGVILISGLLKENAEEMMKRAARYHVKITRELSHGDWICLRLNH